MDKDVSNKPGIHSPFGDRAVLFQELLNIIPDHIYLKDTELRFLMTNEPHARHLGAANEAEVIGKTDYDFYPPLLAERYFTDEKQVLDSGHPMINKQEPVQDRAGNIKWYISSKIPFRDANEKIIGIVGIGRDITREKEYENSIKQKNKELVKIKKELETATEDLDMELDMARRIQHSILPDKLPSIEGYRFSVQYIPSGKVGGDFYNLFLADPDHLVIYEADVSGHGVPAAFVTAFAKSCFDRNLASGRDLSAALMAINGELCEYIKTEHYVTAFIGILNLSTGMLRFSRTGHPYALYYQQTADRAEYLISKGGHFLGMIPDTAVFEENALQLESGDKLLIYTDGLTESQNSFDEQFGRKNLAEAVAQNKHLKAEAFLKGILEAKDSFVKSCPSKDDITLIGIERK